jgi:hypothetical protein
MFRGQMQLNGGYKFAIRNALFDNDGKKIFLKNRGTGSIYHYYFADIRYGITNFLEISAGTNFIRKAVREPSSTTVSVTATSTDRITVNKLTEVKGMGDILLKSSLRLPFKYKGFDLSTTAGIYIPSSKSEPEKPSNAVSNVTAENTYSVNYHYNNTNGYGVPVWMLSASLKTGFRKISLQADFSFRTPRNEGTSIRWEEALVDKIFSYTDRSYSYLLSNSFDLNTSLHYQAIGWFDVYMNCSWQKTKGGWTEYWGKIYQNPETMLLNIEPGFELQISPTVTILQVAGFPVRGIKSDSPFYLFTTIRFSNFPFFRR